MYRDCTTHGNIRPGDPMCPRCEVMLLKDELARVESARSKDFARVAELEAAITKAPCRWPLSEFITACRTGNRCTTHAAIEPTASVCAGEPRCSARTDADEMMAEMQCKHPSGHGGNHWMVFTAKRTETPRPLLDEEQCRAAERARWADIFDERSARAPNHSASAAWEAAAVALRAGPSVTGSGGAT